MKIPASAQIEMAVAELKTVDPAVVERQLVACRREMDEAGIIASLPTNEDPDAHFCGGYFLGLKVASTIQEMTPKP